MRAKTRWMLAAVGVTTTVALTDALLRERLVLIGLLIAGPMLAAIRLDGPRTGLVAAYALGLAVVLGPVDQIWGTADQFQLRLRGTPLLSFVPDPAIALGSRVEELLRDLHRNEDDGS